MDAKTEEMVRKRMREIIEELLAEDPGLADRLAKATPRPKDSPR